MVFGTAQLFAFTPTDRAFDLMQPHLKRADKSRPMLSFNFKDVSPIQGLSLAPPPPPRPQLISLKCRSGPAGPVPTFRKHSQSLTSWDRFVFSGLADYFLSILHPSHHPLPELSLSTLKRVVAPEQRDACRGAMSIENQRLDSVYSTPHL